MRRWLPATLMCLITATACGDQEEQDMDGRSIDTVAQETRAFIDDLAAAVGTDPEVRQDTITDCVPGRRDSGKDLIYIVHVTVDGTAIDRLRTQIADRFEADGWVVKRDADASVRFQRGSSTIGATIFPDQGLAAVSGSGGCVK